MGAEAFHADGRTDTMELIVAFRSFAEVSKSEIYTIDYGGRYSYCIVQLMYSVI